MKLSPELKAFRHYKKNVEQYCEEMMITYPDKEKLLECYARICAPFGADPTKLMDIVMISYNRYTDRVFR